VPAAHLSAKEARQLGLNLTGAPEAAEARPRRRATAYATVCTACGETFTAQAAEDRHLAANPGHGRYELVL